MKLYDKTTETFKVNLNKIDDKTIDFSFRKPIFDEVLMKDMKEHGLLQPVIVFKMTDTDTYHLVLGYRRLTAAYRLRNLDVYGWHEIDCRCIGEAVTSDGYAEIRKFFLPHCIIESTPRQSLHWTEEMDIFHKLREESGLKAKEIANLLNVSEPHLSHMNRIKQFTLEHTCFDRFVRENKWFTFYNARSVAHYCPIDVLPHVINILDLRKGMHASDVVKLLTIVKGHDQSNIS